MQGKTKSGFEFEVDAKHLYNYELLEDLADMADGQEGKIVSVIKRLLGEEQKERLKNHLRDEEGRVPASAMTTEIMEIFTVLKAKN